MKKNFHAFAALGFALVFGVNCASASRPLAPAPPMPVPPLLTRVPTVSLAATPTNTSQPVVPTVALRSVNPTATSVAQATASAPPIRYVEGSTQKVCQLTGETDREFNQPTVNQTETRWGLVSVDGGYAFEHDGKLFFIFGDANPTAKFNGKRNGFNDPPRRWGDNDGPIAFTTDTDIQNCLKLDVVTDSI